MKVEKSIDNVLEADCSKMVVLGMSRKDRCHGIVL